MRVKTMPMIWVYEVAEEIAEKLKGDSGNIGYDIVTSLTDRDDLIVQTEIPDEETMACDYDMETAMFFRIVMRELNLTYGDEFLVYTE